MEVVEDMARYCTLHYTLHTKHCTLPTAHCTLHTTLHSSHCTLHAARCTLHAEHCTLHTAHWYIGHCTYLRVELEGAADTVADDVTVTHL